MPSEGFQETPAPRRDHGPQGLGKTVACVLGECAEAGKGVGAVEEEFLRNWFEETACLIAKDLSDAWHPGVDRADEVRLSLEDRRAVDKASLGTFGSLFPNWPGLMGQTAQISQTRRPSAGERESVGVGFLGGSQKRSSFLKAAVTKIAGGDRALANRPANNAGTSFFSVFSFLQQTGHASPRCATWSVFFCPRIALNRKGAPHAI